MEKFICLTSFTGPIGASEIVLLLLFLTLPIPIIIALVYFGTKKKKQNSNLPETQLAELESLYSKKLITKEEYQTKRQSILSRI